jgi:hypothetical protein
MESAEPRLIISKTLIDDPNRDTPYMDKELPSRITLLIEKLEPRCKQSMTDKHVPTRESP